MRVAVPRESRPGERRVAATPDTVQRLVKLGFRVSIEHGAGSEAGYTDPTPTSKRAPTWSWTRSPSGRRSSRR